MRLADAVGFRGPIKWFDPTNEGLLTFSFAPCTEDGHEDLLADVSSSRPCTAMFISVPAVLLLVISTSICVSGCGMIHHALFG